jgi:SAM-dependent methyltransferase
MGWYEERILPRVVDLALSSSEFDKMRGRVAAGLSGEVLEVGFGSGRNMPHLPGAVTRLRAVDPAALGRRLAAKRLAQSPIPIEFVGLDGADLPLEDNSVDHVLTTWTLCTIPAVERALREFRRVLRPGGALHFIEHGLAPDARVARWQGRLNPIQKRVAGGCHLNRPIDRLIEGAGFETEKLDRYYASGPKPYVCQYEGVAVSR